MKKFLLATFLIFSFLPIPVDAQRNLALMQLGELTESNGAANDEFGYYAAISGDTAIANRAYYIQSFAVEVFVKGSSGWGNMIPSATLTGSNGLVQFYDVAISGNTALSRGYDTSTQTWATYVFVKPSGGWTGTVTETAVLGTGFDGTPFINGNTIAVGAGGYYEIFVKPAGGWKSTSTANATLIQYAEFTSFAINGNTAVIGDSASFGYQGTVYVFSKPAGGWSGTLSPTAKLLASNAHLSDGLGSAVAISGNTIVATAEGVNQAAGAAYVFVEPPGGWVDTFETAELTAPNTIELGYSASISGNAIVVGAPFNDVGFNQFQGAVYVFTKPANGWKTTSIPNAELTATDGAQGDELGLIVGISGGAILATSPNATVGSNAVEGAAYIFGK